MALLLLLLLLVVLFVLGVLGAPEMLEGTTLTTEWRLCFWEARYAAFWWVFIPPPPLVAVVIVVVDVDVADVDGLG